MNNYIQSGKTLTFVAPAGGVVAGGGYIIGGVLVVAHHAAAVGEDFDGLVEDVVELPKNTAQAFTAGQILYWDPTPGELTTSATAGNLLCGFAAAPALAAAASGRVKLHGVARAVEP